MTPAIMISGHGTIAEAIEATRAGAFDFLEKPLGRDKVLLSLKNALEQASLRRENERLRELVASSTKMIGASPAFVRVVEQATMAARSDARILIMGESGTGNELLAAHIPHESPFANGPFVKVNCAAIPSDLLESELFGHEKGAFTGADRRRIGKFEQCHDGTLFLDEIGDMPLALQAKMLRLLQEQSFERVGGNETVRTDVRLIAATHRDLTAWSAEGKFRPDLYYRLGVFTIHLPPLRERGDDLPLLVHHYLRRISRELGREIREVDPETLERLRNGSWPGNIRELQSVLTQALLQASGTILLPAFLPDLTGGLGESGPEAADFGLEAFLRKQLVPDASDLYAETHRQLDRLFLPRVLEYTGGNQHQAARLLGIARQTLRQKLRDLGLHVTRSVEGDEDNRC